MTTPPTDVAYVVSKLFATDPVDYLESLFEKMGSSEAAHAFGEELLEEKIVSQLQSILRLVDE